MRTLAVFAVVGALAAVAASFMLQTRSSDLPLIQADPQANAMPQPPAPAARAEAPSDSVGAVSPTSPPNSLVTDDMMVQFDQTFGVPLAAYLQAGGLSKADSERIVATAFTEAMECGLQAMQLEAESRGITPDALLDRLRAWQRDRNAVPQELLDAINAREAPCWLNAAQRAGIPPSVVNQVAQAAAANVPAAEQ
jgi:hypothetical protein